MILHRVGKGNGVTSHGPFQLQLHRETRHSEVSVKVMMHMCIQRHMNESENAVRMKSYSTYKTDCPIAQINHSLFLKPCELGSRIFAIQLR